VVARGRTCTVSELSNENICAFTRSVAEDEAKAFLQDAGSTGSFGPLSLLFIINTSDEEQTVDLSLLPAEDVDDNGSTGGNNMAGNNDPAGREEASYAVTYQLNTSQAVSSLSNGMLTVAPYGIVALRGNQ
jgi:hypothetical protein